MPPRSGNFSRVDRIAVREEDRRLAFFRLDAGRVDAEHVIVEGVNVAKKATKPNPMTGVTGGIVDKTMPIHVSNVALFNAATGKADRVGFKDVDGKKVRVFKSNGEVVKG